MISIGIFINNKLIGKATCHRIKEPNEDGEATYKLFDSDETIMHNPEHGAVALAKKMVDKVKLQ